MINFCLRGDHFFQPILTGGFEKDQALKVTLHLRIFLRVLTDRVNRKTLRIPPELAMFTSSITYHIIYFFEIQTFTSL